jgi:hypothetical protein
MSKQFGNRIKFKGTWFYELLMKDVTAHDAKQIALNAKWWTLWKGKKCVAAYHSSKNDIGKAVRKALKGKKPVFLTAGEIGPNGEDLDYHIIKE